MKTILDTKTLRDALMKLKGIGHRHTLSVLSNAHIECTDGKVVITATDKERSIRVELESENSEALSFLLPRRETLQFLGGANGKVEITKERTTRKVVVSREGVGALSLWPDLENDFPPESLRLPQKPLSWQSLDAGYFCRMLSAVSTACLREPENRPALKGVVFKDGEMVAADGFRLVVLKDGRLNFGLGDSETIVPLETVDLILRLFRKEKTIDIAFEVDDKNKPTHTHFKVGGTTLVSELVQEAFPNYKLLIPKRFDSKVSFSAPLMEQRLKMLDPMYAKSGVMRFEFLKRSNEEHECVMRAGETEICEYSLRCPVKVESREGSKVAFNYRYVLDTLKPFSVCSLELTSPSSPGKFTGDVKGLTIVVMPMFVQW